MKKTAILLILALTMCVPQAWSKGKKDKKSAKGYHLELTIEDNKDSMMFLGFYYAGSTRALDTARRDQKGRFVFDSKDQTLEPGMYFFFNPGGNFVEFIVYHEKVDFVFATKQEDWTYHLTCKGSAENDIFCDFHRRSGDVIRDIEQHRGKMDSADFARYRMERRREVDQIKLDIIANHGDCMLAKLTNATRPIDPPVVNEKGDSLTRQQRYEYYASHYWDNFPLDDDFLVRTPKDIFAGALTNYMDRTLQGLPPTMLEPYLDSLIERSRPSKENFKYLVHTITEHYLQSKVMVYDEVYVHLVKRYWETGETFWSSPSVVQEQVERANKWERILVGKVAPELMMKDTNGFVHSLHQTGGDFKLLVFWSPTCGHCKTMIPELHEAWAKAIEKWRVSVFAVLTEPDEHGVKLWKDFINKKDLDGWFHLNGGEANVDWREVYDVETTPQIFLLNSENVIMAKKLDAKMFERIMESVSDPN